MKNLIISAHKNTYYTASALLLRALKDADIEFTEADECHNDLRKYVNSRYENIYVIGVRLKDDYKDDLKDALERLSAGKKAVKFYLIQDRFEIQGKEAKYFSAYLSLTKEKSNLMEIIKQDFPVTGSEYSRLSNLYRYFEAKEYGRKIRQGDESEDTANYVDYTIKSYWKWHVGELNIFRELISRLALDNITEEEFLASKNFEEDDYVLTGSSRAVNVLRSKIMKIAPYKNMPVLIYGETGSGKEIAARLIHQGSGRKGSLVPINCAGLKPELLEATLFGYVKGAFTDAKENKPGVFETADGGTVFLDEITCMDMSVQAKLLRFLEDFKFSPLGSTDVKKADIRIIAATNENIKKQIKEEKFRADLYYRISGVELETPSLKQRKEDIPEMAKVILYRLYRQGYGRVILKKEEYKILKSYDWPGNVRQMHKFLMRCIIFNARGDKMKEMLKEMAEEEEDIMIGARDLYDETKIITIKEAEKIAIERALKNLGYNKTKAAEALGYGSINTLKAKMKEYKIEDK